MDIQIINNCSNNDSAKITELLAEHNAEQGHITRTEYYTITAKDGETLLGGANIVAKWDWIHLDDLYVIDKGQGTGKKIMSEVEKIARKNNKIGIYVFTGEFQTPAFYKTLGYKETGRIPKLVDGHDEILMVKEFS